MTYITLDHIARSYLHSRQLTMHWYLQALKLASDCLRELTFDTLKVVNSRLLDVDGNGVVELPHDYVDWVMVGAGVSQIVYQLSQYDGIKQLANKDADGVEIPYDIVNYGNVAWSAMGIYTNMGDYGEDLGRMPGARPTIYPEGFKVIRERGVIQMSEAYCGTQIILDYIGDGSGCDNASRIHPYAQATIEAYIDWQRDRNERGNNFSPKGNKFLNSQRILRGRLDPITKEDLLNIIVQNQLMIK